MYDIAKYLHSRGSGTSKIASGRGRKVNALRTRFGGTVGVKHHRLLREETWEEADLKTGLSFLAQARHILKIVRNRNGIKP